MTQDLLDEVMNPNYAEGPRSFFGRFDVDVHYVALVKGVGRVDFDPNVHKAEQRCTAIDMSITQLDPGRPTIERSVIAESKEWAKLTLPTLQALGVKIRDIVGRYVRVETAPTGETYVNKQGETKEKTALKFVQIFESESECREASEIYWSSRRMDQGDTGAAPATESAAAGNERETARKFLPVLVKQAGGDVAKLDELIKKNPIVSRHFDVSSPEVVELVGVPA